MSEILELSAGIGVSILIFFVACAILFLLIGIFIVIICSNKRIFIRYHKIWNSLTKIYFIYIPLVFAVFGALIGGIYGLSRSVSNSIVKNNDAIVRSVMNYLPDFQKYLVNNTNNTNITNLSVDHLIDNFFVENDTLKKHSFINKFQNKIAKMVFKGVIEGIIAYSAHETDLKKSNIKATIELLSGFSIEHANKDFTRFLIKILTSKMNGFFKALYFNQLTNLFLFLLLPFIETSIYFIYKKNNKNIQTQIVS